MYEDGIGYDVGSQRGLIRQIGDQGADEDGDPGTGEGVNNILHIFLELVFSSHERVVIPFNGGILYDLCHQCPVGFSVRVVGCRRERTNRPSKCRKNSGPLNAKEKMFQPDMISERVHGTASTKGSVILIVSCINHNDVWIDLSDFAAKVPERIAVYCRHTQVDDFNFSIRHSRDQVPLNTLRKAVVEVIGEPCRSRPTQRDYPENIFRFTLLEWIEGDGWHKS